MLIFLSWVMMAQNLKNLLNVDSFKNSKVQRLLDKIEVSYVSKCADELN